jgi:PhnB protein
MEKTEHVWTGLVQPYLFFDGRCEEAIEFYKRAVGAEVTRMMRFKENPEPAGAGGCAPNSGEKIMHASLKIGEGVVMLSDGKCTGKPNFEGFSLSIILPDLKKIDRFFAALSEGGQVIMPLTKTFYAARFGMVTDRFGVCWMLLVEP